MSAELYQININWTTEGEYEPEWHVLTKDEFLNNWKLGGDNFTEMNTLQYE